MPGRRFVGWTGDAACAGGSVTMDSAHACTATFAQGLQTLTISRAGTGTGTVSSLSGRDRLLSRLHRGVSAGDGGDADRGGGCRVDLRRLDGRCGVCGWQRDDGLGTHLHGELRPGMSRARFWTRGVIGRQRGIDCRISPSLRAPGSAIGSWSWRSRPRRTARPPTGRSPPLVSDDQPLTELFDLTVVTTRARITGLHVRRSTRLPP